MSRKSVKNALRVAFSLSVTVAVVVAVLLSPAVTMGLTATNVNNKETATQPGKYKLGELVTFTSEINFTEGETRDISKVHWRVTGPQPVDLDLPIIDTGGSFFDITYLLPTDGAGNRLGSLKAKIEITNLTFNPAYGYKGKTGGGKIKYTLKYLPPVIKHPAPPPAPGPINNPGLAFPVPGGAAGGGPDTETAVMQFPIPFVPGVAADGEPRGLYWDPASGQLLVLMDGTADDVLLYLNPFAGFLFSFTPLVGIGDATGVTVANGDVYVLREGPSGKQLVRVVDNAPTGNPPSGNTMSPIAIPDTVPGGDVVASGPNVFTVDNQPVAGAGIKFREFNPTTGTAGGTATVPDGPSGGGFTALTTGGPLTGFLGGFEKTIVHFDGTGFVVGATELDDIFEGAPFDIQGLARDPGYGGPGARVLVADGGTSAIYSVIIGAGTGGGGGSMAIPRAITGGTSPFYILVDDSPDDRILKVQDNGNGTATLLDDFDTTSNNVESLVLFGGKLFYVDNAEYPKKLHRVAIDGTMEAHNDLPAFVGDIGDLSADATSLYAVERWADTVHKIAPQTTGGTAGTVIGSFSITDSNFSDPFYPPGGLEAAVYVPPTSPAFLIGGRYSTTWRMDPVTFGIVGGDNIMPGPPWDLTGMTLVGSIIYMTDAATQSVYKGSRPDAPPVDLTTAGNYQAVLQVYVGASLELTSPTSHFVLEKVTTLTVNITSPANNAGFGTPSITVTGNVSDPTAQVTVGVALPEAVLFGNYAKTDASSLEATNDRDQYIRNGMWNFIDFSAAGAIPPGVPADVTTMLTQIGSGNGQVAWYGKFDSPPSIGGPVTPNYDTGMGPGGRNVGGLQTSAFTVGSSGKLTFDTWYDTEPGFYSDQKLIQFCSGGLCNNIAQITGDFPLVSMPGGGIASDFSAAPGTVWQAPPGFGYPTGWKMVYVPAARMDATFTSPLFTTVTLDLAAMGVSGTGKVEFRFDTVDPFGNYFKGWMVDNVLVKGPTTVGGTAIVDRETFTWSVPFTLAEGNNTITATATRSAYDPALSATTTINVLLDSRVPEVSIVAGTTPTNIPARAITVHYKSATPNSLTVTQTTSTGTRVVLVKRTGFSPPEEDVSVPLSLDEGTNTFNATLVSDAGLSGVAVPKVVVLDTVAPVLTTLATVYPVGEVSARPGDMAIFQANATDAGSGILKVEFTPPGGCPAGEVCLMLGATSIPAAVRDQWGTTGSYLLPFDVPSSAAPGTYNVTLKATDNAGNSRTATVSASIVAALQAFNLYLMPGQNLVSLPLQPSTGTSFDVATLLNQTVPNVDATFKTGLGRDAKLSDVIDTISYFTGGTAATGVWQVYTTDAAADTLTTMTTGLGYWIKMKAGVFKLSDPLDVGLPPTPAPMKLTIYGQFLKPGDVPPTYSVVSNWNLVGLHSEKPKTASQFLRGVSVPVVKWASLLEYQNYLKFAEDSAPEIKLGTFNSLFDTDMAQPGRGFWLFMVAPGDITP